MTPKPQANTINQILRGTREDGHFTMAMSDAKQLLLAEVLDIIGEDAPEYSLENPQWGENRTNNRLRRKLRRAAKERFKL